jgi:hypothetical protein
MKSNMLGCTDDISQENIFTYLILEFFFIPLQRYSCDKGRVNKYGNLLLELPRVDSFSFSQEPHVVYCF